MSDIAFITIPIDRNADQMRSTANTLENASKRIRGSHRARRKHPA